MKNTKQLLIATLATFVAWQVTDFLIHGVLLGDTYEATAELWRPMEEMKRPLMMVVSLVAAICFNGIFGLLITNKGMKNGVMFGLLYGVATGFSMGFGTYSFQDIPMSLAIAWFVGSVFQALIAGAIAGAIIKE